MTQHCEETTPWNGREVFDTNGKRIGAIVGCAYGRKRFGVTWLLLQTSSGSKVLIPAEQMTCGKEDLVLPYSAGYVEAAPSVEEEGAALDQAQERRLRLHYGIGSGSPPGGCRAGCGLCMAGRRAQRRSAT